MTDFRLVPLLWMPQCRMQRCIVHWTAGAGRPSPIDLEHYHILFDEHGTAHRGDHSIAANLDTSDDDYAAHTRACNTGSIGLAACGMAGAKRQPFEPGLHPITKACWNGLLLAAADLCRRYDIPPEPKHLLMHCEVERFLGKTQKSKWDISVRTWEPGIWASNTPGEELRARVRMLLEGGR